ncbi:MAG TPA: hypothetical protein VLW50_06350 [Streptosporangiaceae bacterium]|nr:hypothetical protein [Streptosporangiaceae bacterium]
MPIDAGRLEAAARKVGLTIAGLAAKAGLQQQTVDAMRRPARPGKLRRCRRSHRDRLAKALGLDTEEASRWLGKEVARLSPRVGYYGGEIYEYPVGEDPSASELARYHLLQRCLRAWGRDRGTRPENLTSATSTAASAPLQHAINQLADALWWRGQLLNPVIVKPVSGRMPAGRPFPVHPVQLDPATQERIECALLTALEGLLEPWLTGQVALREDNVLALGSLYWWQAVPGAKPV